MENVSTPPAPRHSVSFTTETAAADRLASALEESWPAPDAVGLFETAGGMEIFAHYTEAPDLDAIKAVLAGAAAGARISELRIEALPDADWITISQGKRGAVKAGRFTVHGSHEAPAPCRGTIEIDASAAFGTAHHASTKGCLMLLDRLLKTVQPMTVLDIGTGSGVLAIAAARFGAASVIATDNDAIAVRIGAENAALNGVPQIRFLVAEGFEHGSLRRVRADLVFGNLLKSILMTLAPGFARHTSGRGFAILSGLTDDQAPAIEARFRGLGFIVKQRVSLDGWTSLLLQRMSGTRAGD